MHYSISSFPSEVYTTSDDFFRLLFEIIFALFTVFNLGSELLEMITSKQSTGSFKTYFKSLWNYIDLFNLAVFVWSATYWVRFVRALAVFQPNERYEVLAELRSEANILKLNHEGAVSYMNFVKDTQHLVDLRNRQSFLNGIALLLMICRMLKNLDFQPRLGLITRTLHNAATNLSHFVAVFGLVFFTYSVMGHMAFGGEIENFSSIFASMHTCFGILMGDVELLKDLRTSDNADIGKVFYYSYIGIVFFVLLNILLAILVDAYMEIKQQAEESSTVVKEVKDIMTGGRPGPLRRGQGTYRIREIDKVVAGLLKLAKEKDKTTSRVKKKKIRIRRKGKGTKVDSAGLAELIKEQLEATDARAEEIVVEELAKSFVRIYGKKEEEEVWDEAGGDDSRAWSDILDAQEKIMANVENVKLQIGSEQKFKKKIIKVMGMGKPPNSNVDENAEKKEDDKMGKLMTLMRNIAEQRGVTAGNGAPGQSGGSGSLKQSEGPETIANLAAAFSATKKKPNPWRSVVKSAAASKTVGAKINPGLLATSKSTPSLQAGRGAQEQQKRRQDSRITKDDSESDTSSSSSGSETSDLSD